MSTHLKLTVEQYDRMIEGGVFPPAPTRHRIELVEGDLVQMSPIGPRHEWIVDSLTEWSFECSPRRHVWVRIQNSIGLPAMDSALEPDVCWVKRRRYHRRPEAADILLIIEVADTSLDYDCDEKADLYAAAGISDYWVVNILDECLHIFRQPQSGRYASRDTLRGAAEIRPLAFPEVSLPVSRLFPPDEPADES